MGFSIEAELLAVGIDDDDAIVMRVVGPLEDRDREHDLQRPRQLLHAGDGRMILHRPCEIEEVGRLVLAEIRRLEQLLQQHDLRAASGGRAH